MLATDHDGELVNAARALRRTLNSAGMDLNDLAERLAALSATEPEPEPEACLKFGEWLDLEQQDRIAHLRNIEASPLLTTWERQFVIGVQVHLWRDRPLTIKQTTALQNVFAKIRGLA
ncbi:hypothetical protein [Alsobacter soli]|nr:hypothetical protein [Alsobacter soli]